MSHPLFSPFQLRSLVFANRIGVSPMCQYSSQDGFATDWHLVHLGARAQGGAGLVTLEASAVTPEGRISPGDLGIWKDDHIPALARIAAFIHSQGAQAGIQLAHAGRKASMSVPFAGERLLQPSEGGWQPVAPSAIPFSPAYAVPQALDLDGLRAIVEAFRLAARRALAAGFHFVEIHAAHGYLLHEFLSPIANQRTDGYGGDLVQRTRFGSEVIRAVRRRVGPEFPIIFRFSQWKLQDYEARLVQTAEELGRFLKPLTEAGVDIFHCSTRRFWEPEFMGSNLNLAGWTKQLTGHPTITVGSVGLQGDDFIRGFRAKPDTLTEVADLRELDQRLANEEFDLVAVGRALLQDPAWAAKIREGRTGELQAFSKQAFATLS